MPVQSTESEPTRERKRLVGCLVGALVLLALVVAAGGMVLLTARTPIVVGRYALVGPRCVVKIKAFASRMQTRTGPVTNATLLVLQDGKRVLLADTNPRPRRIGPVTIFGP